MGHIMRIFATNCLMLLIYGCGSGCYTENPTNIHKGLPNYNQTTTVQVKANGNYNPEDASACTPSTDLSHYNQWVSSNLTITNQIQTTINFRVSGTVSMCNGEGTGANLVTPGCLQCSQSGGTSSCCSNCGKDAGETCLSYCNSNNGKVCPFGPRGSLFKQPQCDGNCIYGQRYFIPPNTSNPTVVAKNIYPGDKLTLFVDAPNLCDPLDVSSQNYGNYPEVNRYSQWSQRTLSYPKSLSCSASGNSSSNMPSPPNAPLCNVSTDGSPEPIYWCKNGGGSCSDSNRNYCWASTGNYLLLSQSSSTSCTQDHLGDCIYFGDSSTNSNSNSQFGTVSYMPLYGSPSGQGASCTSSPCPLSCQQVLRTITNNQNSTIKQISMLTADIQGEYGNNAGGYTVYVNHESCITTNGDGYTGISGNSGANYGALEMIAAPPGCNPNNDNCGQSVSLNKVSSCQSTNPDSTSGCLGVKDFCPAWDDCDNSSINNGTYNYYVFNPSEFTSLYPQNEAVLWFRVAPNQPAGSTTPSIATQYAKGSLNVDIAYGTVQPGFSGVVAEIIDAFTNGILNSLSTQFTNIVCTGEPNSCSCSAGENCSHTYFYYIRILLIFYIASYGFLFLLGMVQISQADLIIRVMKIALILALTSSNAWAFFYNNFFALFLEGSTTLISKSVNQAFQDVAGQDCGYITITGYQGAPSSKIQNPFCFLNYGFKLLFTNPNIWRKLAALMFLNPISFLLFFYMIYGLIMYIIAMFKALVSYLMSIISVAILLLLAPIFIPFMLFQTTQQLFSNWLMYLIKYTISPVLLLIGLNILTMLLYLVVQELIDFTVCWGCAIPVSIPPALAKIGHSSTQAFCLPWFVPHGHGAGGAGSSSYSVGLNIVYFMLFIILLNLMKNYGSYVQQITTRLASLRLQQFRTVGGGGKAGSASAMGDTIQGAGLKLIGQDASSKANRAALMDARLRARGSGAEVTMDKAAEGEGKGGAEREERGEGKGDTSRRAAHKGEQIGGGSRATGERGESPEQPTGDAAQPAPDQGAGGSRSGGGRDAATRPGVENRPPQAPEGGERDE